MKYFIIIGFLLFSGKIFGQTNSFPSSGNVGIGTTSPSDKLQIDAANSQIRLRDTDDGKYVQFSYSSGFLAIRNNSTSANHFFLNESGSVGIGTYNPRGIFDISTTGDKYLTSSTESVSTSEDLFLPGHIYFTPTTNAGQVYIQARRQSSSGSTKFNFRTYNNGSLNDAALFIDSNANVGIGVNNPSQKLVVNGNIAAKEVKVSTTPNSDYVFESDYNLRSIKDVEAFVKAYGHLPDIPSAEEFKEKGVGLGEMDNMLLMKVEELTLYVIELKKENEEMKSRINTLENE